MQASDIVWYGGWAMMTLAMGIHGVAGWAILGTGVLLVIGSIVMPSTKSDKEID